MMIPAVDFTSQNPLGTTLVEELRRVKALPGFKMYA
jgi:hypothetical protein